MESVETRKLGKHLFIFEKGKVKSSNNNSKAKGRTLISSCATEREEKLPQEFVKYMRTLFDILDENKTGFVKLRDIEACWGQKNGYSTSQASGVLEQLRRVVPANGLLSFERLCMGFEQALHSTETISMANGFSGARKSGALGMKSDLRPKSKSESTFIRATTNHRSPVSAIHVGDQAHISFPSVREKSSEFHKANGIPQNTHGFSQKPKQERDLPKSVGVDIPQQKKKLPFCANSFRESSKIGMESDLDSCESETRRGHESEEQRRPVPMGRIRQPQQTINLPYSEENCCESNRSHRKTDAVFNHRPEDRKRPRSMGPFSEQKIPVDLSVAKKKGGILEGIEKTDKKAVIDKLKQWRNAELKKNTCSPGRPGVNGVAKQFQRVSKGYQSDNEGCYRQRQAAIPLSCTGNETDSENHRSSMQSSGNSYGRRVPRTTVYYQGEIQTKIGTGESASKTAAAFREQSKTRDIENSRVQIVSNIGDDLKMLKEGLRVVDEVRDCLVKRISHIQERKLYEKLDKFSCEDVYVYNKGKRREIETEIKSGSGNNIGNTGLILDRSHVEALSSHFKGLKAILDQVKHPKS